MEAYVRKGRKARRVFQRRLRWKQWLSTKIDMTRGQLLLFYLMMMVLMVVLTIVAYQKGLGGAWHVVT